jgi:hypothetical protein
MNVLNEIKLKYKPILTHEIKFDEHCTWLENVLENRENNIFYII